MAYGDFGAISQFYADFRQIDDDGRETKNQELRVQAQVVF